MEPRNIYVAGKWEEKERVQEIMVLLREQGHVITYDWTTCAVADRHQALMDLEGVREADAFVGVFEKDLPYAGAYAEFGMACMLGIPCYLIGRAADRCIFTKLPNVHYGISDLLTQEG